MVHDFTSRAAARDLLAESDVVPSDELTEALAELNSLGQRPAPPISPALAEAMRAAAASAGRPSISRSSDPDNVVAFRFGKVRRRGAAIGGAVVLAMAAGMGGVAAFGPDNAVETAIESVIRWVAPAESERTEPVSDEQPAPTRPEPVPASGTASVTEPPVPAQLQDAPQPVPGGVASPEPPVEPESSAPATRKAKPAKPVEDGRGAVPPVELPELSVPVPDPVTTPRSVIPVDPPELSLPDGTPETAPSAEPSR